MRFTRNWLKSAREDEFNAGVVVAFELEDRGLYRVLKTRDAQWVDAGGKSVMLIGDVNARGLDGEDIGGALPCRRVIMKLAMDGSYVDIA